MTKSILNSILVILLFLVTTCQMVPHTPPSGRRPATPTTMKKHHEDEVDLTKEQISKIGLTLGSFTDKNLQSTLKVTGKLKLFAPTRSQRKLHSGRVVW